MHLQAFRIIGHPLLPDSSWTQVGRGLNVLRTQDDEQAQALLATLQTINPPYNCQQINPFGNFSRYASSHQYSRKIILSKKTAALAIFVAGPQIVEELAALDPILYETDRIEIGRRRDYSQWMNFVELAGSTRWSEIAAIVDALLPLISPEATQVSTVLQATLGSWQGTDRIRGLGARQLKAQLQTLRAHLPKEYQTRLDPCFQAIDRALHFTQAKAIVAARLPLFLSLAGATAEPPARGAEAGSAPFNFLAARLRASHADKASWEHRLQQINSHLHTLHPDLHLCFREEGALLLLESSKGTTPLLFTELAPIERIMALQTGLAVLHEAIYACQPIFLLDIQEINLQPQEQDELLDRLHHACAHRQCLVAPDSAFLALCSNSYRETENVKYPWLRLIGT